VVSMERGEADKLLGHWIEHNEAHSRSFRERADQIEEISPDAAQIVRKAADQMDECAELLRKAKAKL
jgi:ABC-type transporter Mla subunit MlaD